MFKLTAPTGNRSARVKGGGVRSLAFASLIGVVVSQPALAAPIYLNCVFDATGPAHPIQLTADEANSVVTVFVPSSGKTFRMAAAFTPDAVNFEDSDISYNLSRTDLSIVRTIKFIRDRQIGRCELKEAPKRAF